jgi:hypothetical protein
MKKFKIKKLTYLKFKDLKVDLITIVLFLNRL